MWSRRAANTVLAAGLVIVAAAGGTLMAARAHGKSIEAASQAPADAAGSQAVAQSRPESQPASSPAGGWPKPGELKPGEMKTQVDRWMVVRSGGRRIGHMHYTVVDFVDTHALRTGLEYFLFPDQGGMHGYRYWAVCYNSVNLAGQPLASWMTGMWAGQGYNYRLEPGKDHVTIRRNKYGESLFPHPIDVVPDYLLYHHLLARVRASLSEKGKTFACRRFAWDVPTPALFEDSMATFPPYVYVYEGPETITSAEGQKISAHRFREQHSRTPSGWSISGWTTKASRCVDRCPTRTTSNCCSARSRPPRTARR